MVNDFLRAIIEKRPPLVTADECRRSMQLITGMYKSAMTGARVALPIAPDDPFYSCIPPEGFALPA
jgi:predicted dehydrogenase